MVQSIHKQYYQYIAMWHALLKNLKICLKCVIFSHDIARISSQLNNELKIYFFLVNIYLFLEIYHITKLLCLLNIFKFISKQISPYNK